MSPFKRILEGRPNDIDIQFNRRGTPIAITLLFFMSCAGLLGGKDEGIEVIAASGFLLAIGMCLMFVCTAAIDTIRSRFQDNLEHYEGAYCGECVLRWNAFGRWVRKGIMSKLLVAGSLCAYCCAIIVPGALYFVGVVDEWKLVSSGILCGILGMLFLFAAIVTGECRMILLEFDRRLGIRSKENLRES